MGSKLIINLKSLSNQGLSLSYQPESAEELSQKLKPLIGENSYSIQANLRPAGKGAYIIFGNIQTRLKLLCSRCAYEFEKPIDKNFEEKIFLREQKEKIQIPSNHSFSELMSEEDWTVANSPFFNMGEFLHELIAIEEPLRPLASSACDMDFPPCERLEAIKRQVRQSGADIHFS